ncbi:hypothetical protein [Cellulosimicrobium protaetiae]|uniref:Lipoprotein n=1 Tax=Cellulosimicrobium protaetiae TaxID=2587808 RepID=A0A6M5UH22_9MICO|nr:hypothetical protein [Cellulosimicrobium protaetiae]QJW36565.1 hypothetical protein FIC82_010535 [Cellulosimicrobium protaetiae]
MPPRSRARAPRTQALHERGAALLAAGLLGVTLGGCQPNLDDVQGAAAARDAQESPDAAAGAPGTPLPQYDAASAVGDLVEGFPAELVTVPPGSQVLASSARPSQDGALVEVTLNLRSDETVDALTAYYTDALGTAGFVVSPSSVPSALTSLTTFVRTPAPEAPTESLAVGVFDDESERLVTISGQVVAG